MKRLLLGMLFAIASSATFAQTADFSGIWAASTGSYLSVHQKGSVVIMAFLGDTDAFRGWEALRGDIAGSKARVTTLYGYVGVVYDAELTSPTTLKATLISCKPLVAGYACRPNGSTLTATKIF
jgi:hypothetical protein